MSRTSNFQVDPKLAELLGETYKSTEDALKELVDNAYDADSDEIRVTLPEPMTENPIITIVDDGTGMKEEELRSEYLRIASSRFSRKGEKTLGKERRVKGRKGIGKFSGLMVAEIMEVRTCAGGKQTTLTIIKSELAKAKYDLEKVQLQTEVDNCDKTLHGTTITLKGLNQNFNFPNPEKLKEILVWDYSRVADLSIYVNKEKIGIQDYQGKTLEKEIELSEGRIGKLVYTITDKPVKNAGIIYRVGNKIIGRPENFLKEDEIIPDKLKKRIVGEIICDDLEDFATADHAAIVENSKLNDEIKKEVKSELTTSLNEVFKSEMHLARLRYQQKINRELQKLPEYKRQFAEKSLQRVLEKFYGEPEDKVNTIISVMVDALEKDSYWNVIRNIEEARDGDIEKFADALSDFGFMEMSIVAGQALNRLRFLDELDLLRSNPKTLEATMHKALENNLWVLGSEYSLIFSNKTLATAIKDYLDKKFTGKRANKRPDLFLGMSITRQYLLIEFKRPSDEVGRDAEAQAIKYTDDLNSVINNKEIQIWIIGGTVDKQMSPHNERKNVKFLSYTDVISNARAQLDWLLSELKNEK
ncbi:MAG TPA: ATP-binding protein [Leptospiraceae bacterium]|nr:ATP-binding protein [Leptospiraceae bacterium]HRG73342.1 ATP-binding protein [Leptospiraceae bacterium]